MPSYVLLGVLSLCTLDHVSSPATFTCLCSVSWIVFMLTKWQPVKLILFWGRGQSGRVPNLARRLGDVQQWYFMLPVSGCTLEHIPVEVRMWPWWCFLTWCIAFSLRHWLFHCSVFELMEPCVIANDDRLRQCCDFYTQDKVCSSKCSDLNGEIEM